MSLQSTVSESTLVALLAARKNKILEMKISEQDTDESSLNSRLIAYASDQVRSYGYKENRFASAVSPRPHNVNSHSCTKRKTETPHKHERISLMSPFADGETKSV